MWMAVAAMLVPGPTWILAEAVDADSVLEKRTLGPNPEVGPPVRILDINSVPGHPAGRVRMTRGGRWSDSPLSFPGQDAWWPV
ncbi:MAG: hypothetical protein Ct9H300mP1_06560 [Planctomycetaceae bacterium]|nr:MAG: hypothetical protein Ct9H300mP1_06560 [Planctomycetaceae bacterium]